MGAEVVVQRPDIRSEPEAQLLARARAGDREAFGELHRRHHPAALGYARRLGVSSVADDIVSEAFTATMRALLGGRGPVDCLVPYLFVAIRNQAIRQGKQKHGEVVGVSPTPAWDRVGRLDPAEADPDERLERAFAALNARHREVLFLTVVEDLPAHVVADRLGLSREALAALAYRARRALRAGYDADGSAASPTTGRSASAMAPPSAPVAT